MAKPQEEHKVIERALALEHDCQAAYTEAAEKASDAELSKHLTAFAADCGRHIEQWRAQLEHTPEKETSFSKPLNQACAAEQHAQLAGSVCMPDAVHTSAGQGQDGRPAGRQGTGQGRAGAKQGLCRLTFSLKLKGGCAEQRPGQHLSLPADMQSRRAEQGDH